MVYMLAVFLALNLSQDRVSLGMYRQEYTVTTNTPSEMAILTEFHDMLEKGGSTVTIVPDIQRMKFKKNFWNISFSSFATLVGYRLPAFFRAPPKDGEYFDVYVSETTRDRVEEYTIPNLRAVLEEVLSLGMLPLLLSHCTSISKVTNDVFQVER